jgi:hypothetical protein
MVLGAVAMLILTGVTVHSSYVTHVLPGLLVMGLGLGLIMAPAMSTATVGVDRRDPGVASAMVNTGQQIGGSIGTALLSTLASSAANSYAAAHLPAVDLDTQAAVRGYTAAFTWSAAILAAAALAPWPLLPSGGAGARTRGSRRAGLRSLRQLNAVRAARRARPVARPSRSGQSRCL